MYKGNFSRVSFNSLYPNIIYSHIDLDSQNVTELLHLYLNYKNDLDYSKELWIYLKVCASSLYGSYLTSNERSLVTERARRYLLDFKYLVETVHNSKVYYIDTDMLIIENFRNDTIDFFKSIIGINIPIIFENSKYGFVFENKKKFTFI
jgi:DNA polymerase elongation subunit (family B)